MSPRPRFVLNFSGTGMLEKTANATKRLRGLAADEHTSRARLCAIIAASSWGVMLCVDSGTCGKDLGYVYAPTPPRVLC